MCREHSPCWRQGVNLLLLSLCSQVSKVVIKVKQLVNVAKINSTLASTVVTIISNVMSSSETALAASSETYAAVTGPLLWTKVDVF